jgi:hypothetical protein
MRMPYAQVKDENIREADVIVAIDPRHGVTRPVFGQPADARVQPFQRHPPTARTLEVEMDADEETAYQLLCGRVAVVKAAQKDDSASELAKRHFEVEAGLTRIIRFSGSADVRVQAAEPIKFLEVNENTVASGVMPLGFDAAPASGIHFPSVIIEVTPREFEQIQAEELKLPRGWEVRREEMPRPSTTSGV